MKIKSREDYLLETDDAKEYDFCAICGCKIDYGNYLVIGDYVFCGNSDNCRYHNNCRTKVDKIIQQFVDTTLKEELLKLE
jgi:hypothetical protein